MTSVNGTPTGSPPLRTRVDHPVTGLPETPSESVAERLVVLARQDREAGARPVRRARRSGGGIAGLRATGPDQSARTRT
jgi:hypothetical protein